MADMKRLNYFNSEFLVDQDFKDEQAYHLGMRRRHNRVLHTWGVANGLLVSRASDKAVAIDPGTALDKDGQEIVVLDSRQVDLSAFAANDDVYITCEYQELQLEADHYQSGGVDNYTRTTESPKITGRTSLPPSDGSVVTLAKVHLDAGGNVTVPDPSVRQIAGSVLPSDLVVKSLSLMSGGAPSSQWPRLSSGAPTWAGLSGSLSVSGAATVTGSVGIGTAQPDRSLTIANATGANYLNVKDGVHEILLGADAAGGLLSVMSNHDLVLRAGGNIEKMRITAAGKVGIGTPNPGAPLHVATYMAVGPFSATTGDGGIDVTGSAAELGFVKRSLTAWPATPAAGDRFVWYNPDGTARLWTEQKGDLLMVDVSGNLSVIAGELRLPETGGVAAFTNQALGNEASFKSNNLKLRMGSTGGLKVFPGGIPAPFEYEFAIGHTFLSPILGGGASFVKTFSVTQAGDLFCAGSKTGYVVDFFINRVGDTLEQGDVVVISQGEQVRFYGTHDNIPIPEVDLSDHAYDRRVCGIVAQFVTEADLPMVEIKPVAQKEGAKTKKKEAPTGHPLAAFAANAAEQPDHTKVADQQLGKMATLGAFAHCKVDADIAPIEAGDLLTTSPTKGHAQKVLDAQQAVGAIVGKALASLKKGKGKIPVLVMLE